MDYRRVLNIKIRYYVRINMDFKYKKHVDYLVITKIFYFIAFSFSLFQSQILSTTILFLHPTNHPIFLSFSHFFPFFQSHFSPQIFSLYPILSLLQSLLSLSYNLPPPPPPDSHFLPLKRKKNPPKVDSCRFQWSPRCVPCRIGSCHSHRRT